MKYLWLFYFPILFLPNLGYSQVTGFGTLEFSDFLIGPYFGLLLLAVTWRDKLYIGRMTPWLGIFIGWAMLSTVTISVRYGYADDFVVEFGLLKIAKIALYGLAGILTARALARPETRERFHWSLLAAAVISGVAILRTGSGQSGQEVTDQGYSASNGISVLMALLFLYLAGRILIGQASRWWRLMAAIGLVIMVIGWTLSDGRGGWLAAAAGIVYFVVRLGFRRQMIAFALVTAVVFSYLYQSEPQFQRQVDMTLFPVEEYGLQGSEPVGPIDDAGRIQTWEAEARKLDRAPWLGAGIHHRGGLSPLWTTGSHNFWLQMFLELGIVGGLLALGILVTMWRQASQVTMMYGRHADIPLKAALVGALVGGLGGEYFYGGIILFTLLAVYAPTGGLPVLASLAGDRYRAALHVPAGPVPRQVGTAGD